MPDPTASGTPALVFLTVTLKREFAGVRVLAESIRVHEPAARVVVVVADLVTGDVLDAPEAVEIVTGHGFGLPVPAPLLVALDPEEIRLRALFLALDDLLDADDARVLLLEPTSVLCAPLGPLGSTSADVTLVPRRLAPVAKDDLRPTAHDVEGLGEFDAGLMVLRGGSRAREVVAGWRDAVTVEPPDGHAGRRFSRAVDAVAREPGVAVMEVPGVTVGWWNADQHQFGGTSDALLADGSPVRVLRFAGFDAARPEILSPRQTRVRLSRTPALAALAGWYAERTGTELDPPLGPGDLPADLDPLLARPLLREAVQCGVVDRLPLDEQSTDAFRAFVREVVEPGARYGLTRYVQALWNAREDLREVYPDLAGQDGEGYAGWVWVYGAELVPVDLRPPVPAHVVLDEPPEHEVPSRPPWERDPLWGVNVAGFFRAELGLGEAARLLIAGLDAARVPALPVQGTYVPPCRQGAAFTFATPAEAPYPLNILCLNGDAIPGFAREAGPDYFRGRHTIALWWWEVGPLPEGWQKAFDYVDEVWVATDHIRALVEPHSPVPVHRITLPVSEPPVVPRSRTELGLPEDGYHFLYVYDYHSTEARKNPSGLVRAFREAFPPGGGAKLVLKCINAENAVEHHERVLLAAGDHPDILVVDRYLSGQDKNALIAACDCYVSPHRSEGFGLTPAEAMLLGKPVIATRYGGTMEFTTDENSYLVDFVPALVGPRADPYPEDGEWADPDLGHLAHLMRHVFEHPQEAVLRGARAAEDMRHHHSPAVAGASMEVLLRPRYEALADEGVRALAVREAPEMVDLGSTSREIQHVLTPADERGGRVRGRVRQVRERLFRPVTARRDVVDQQTIEALHRLDAEVRQLTAELDRHRMAGHAEVLAQFRRVGQDLAGIRGAGERREQLLRHRDDETTRELHQHLAEHRSLPYMADNLVPQLFEDNVAGRVLGYRTGHASPAPYRAFTDAFRGPEERVRELQLPYLPLLEGHAPVLDVGCGRGELLDLLAERGVEARGVDGDEGMVMHARAKGHDVALADGTDHLAVLPEASLGAIVALEVVEHMSAAELERFLSVALGRLRPGGFLVAETVNPHVVHALKAFWLDPTHHHPLFPEVLLTLARIAGYDEVFVFHPTGTGDVELDRFREPAYALVAKA